MRITIGLILFIAPVLLALIGGYCVGRADRKKRSARDPVATKWLREWERRAARELQPQKELPRWHSAAEDPPLEGTYAVIADVGGARCITFLYWTGTVWQITRGMKKVLFWSRNPYGGRLKKEEEA